MDSGAHVGFVRHLRTIESSTYVHVFSGALGTAHKMNRP